MPLPDATSVKCQFSWAALQQVCLRINHFAPPTTLAGYHLTPSVIYSHELAAGQEVTPDFPAYTALVCLGGGMRLLQPQEHAVTPGTVWLQQPGQAVRWVVGAHGLFYFYLFFTVEPAITLKARSVWPSWPWVIQEFALMVEESQLNLPGWPERAGLRCTTLLSRCFTLAGELAAPSAPSACPVLVHSVERYLLTHLALPVRIQELAAHLQLSPRTLMHRYRQETGGTVMAHLHALRLRTASHLLTQTDLSLTDIASQVGIPEKTYFCRVFRRHFGVSPQRYRHEQQRADE